MIRNNIIISANSSWNIYNFRINLLKNLLNRNFKIKILIPYIDKYSIALEKMGCEIFIIKFSPRKKSILESMILFFKYIYYFNKIKPKYFLSFTIKPNLIGTISSLFFNIKVINNITGLGSVFIQNKYLIKIIVMIAYKVIFIKSTVVFFQNKTDQSLFIKHRLIKKSKAILIPGSGINLDLYKYCEPINKINRNFNFLYYGRVISEKGILELINAITKVKAKNYNISFMIIGNTDINDNKYYEITKALKQYNYLFSHKNYTDDIIKYIKTSDCVILPSYREGMPRTLLESAALGVPIMASNVAGCNDIIINDKTGLLFNVKDPSDIVSKIMFFVNMSHKEKIRLTKNARKKIEKEFDEKIVIEKYNNHIR